MTVATHAGRARSQRMRSAASTHPNHPCLQAIVSSKPIAARFVDCYCSIISSTVGCRKCATSAHCRGFSNNAREPLITFWLHLVVTTEDPDMV